MDLSFIPGMRGDKKRKPSAAQLAKSFQLAMAEMYRQVRIKCRQDSSLFARMVNKRGGVAAAKRLLSTALPSEEFFLLREKGSLGVSAEALVLREEFHDLFTDRERKKAAERLRRYGFDPDALAH